MPDFQDLSIVTFSRLNFGLVFLIVDSTQLPLSHSVHIYYRSQFFLFLDVSVQPRYLMSMGVRALLDA